MDSSFDSTVADDAARHQHELLQRSRQGDPDAFGELALDHRQTALRVAAAASRSVDPEDVVAEALTRIWASLRAGGGPESSFGPYLRATVRNVAITMATREREQPTAQDHLELAMQRSARAESDGFSELLIEHSMIAEAYAALPERWRQILWEVDVQGRKAAEVGAELGLSPNSAAALTKRARQGLSRAWLQQLIESGGTDPDCEWVRQRAGGYVRHALGESETERVRAHLDECPDCTRAFARLADLGRHLRVAAMIAGGSAAAIFSLTRTAGTAAAAGLGPAGSPSRPIGRGRQGTIRRAGRVVVAAAGAAAVVATAALAQSQHGGASAAQAPAGLVPGMTAQPSPRSSAGGVQLGVWTITPEPSQSVPSATAHPVLDPSLDGNGGRPERAAATNPPRPSITPTPSGAPTSTDPPTVVPQPSASATTTPDPATPIASALPTSEPSASPTTDSTTVPTSTPGPSTPSPTADPTTVPAPTSLPTSPEPTTEPTSWPSMDPSGSPSPNDPPECWSDSGWWWPGHGTGPGSCCPYWTSGHGHHCNG